MALTFPDTPYGATLLLGGPGFTIPSWLLNACYNMPMSWVRVQIPWTAIFPSATPSTWDWSFTDSVIPQCNAKGINYLFNCLSLPLWSRTVVASDGNTRLSPSIAATLVTAIMKRYGPGSSIGEIQGFDLNEDFDSSQPSNTAANNGGYAGDVLNAIYPIIKSYAPKIPVGCAAHLQVGKGHVTLFQQQLYTGGGVSQSGGAGGSWDFTNCHLYRGNLTDPLKEDVNLVNLYEMITYVNAVDASYGYGALPVWITEIGWAAIDPPPSGYLTHAQQATFHQEGVEMARTTNPCTHYFVYTMAPSDSNSIVAQGSPTVFYPAYTAMANEAASYPTWNSEHTKQGSGRVALRAHDTHEAAGRFKLQNKQTHTREAAGRFALHTGTERTRDGSGRFNTRIVSHPNREAAGRFKVVAPQPHIGTPKILPLTAASGALTLAAATGQLTLEAATGQLTLATAATGVLAVIEATNGQMNMTASNGSLTLTESVP